MPIKCWNFHCDTLSLQLFCITLKVMSFMKKIVLAYKIKHGHLVIWMISNSIIKKIKHQFSDQNCHDFRERFQMKLWLHNNEYSTSRMNINKNKFTTGRQHGIEITNLLKKRKDTSICDSLTYKKRLQLTEKMKN